LRSARNRTSQLSFVHNQECVYRAEYFYADTDRRRGDDLSFDGWYIQTAYVPTGESRNYNPSAGKFGRFKPARPVGSGGPGAWQLAARISEVDLTDGMIEGGAQSAT
jgi:Phosphate-selective porin